MDDNERLRLAKEALDSGSYDRETIEYIFPELQESEDEKIRKAIVEFFELQDDNTTYSFIPKKDILAWLEKQAPKNKTALDKAIEEEIDAWLEKQGEQKSKCDNEDIKIMCMLMEED